MHSEPNGQSSAPRTDPSAASSTGAVINWPLVAWVFALPGLVILISDLATKAWVFREGSLAAAQLHYLGHPWIQPHVNTGVAWSLFDEHPEYIAILTAILIPVLAWVWWRWFRSEGWLEHLAFGCILGGAVGNGWDRFSAFLTSDSVGGVRDFIHCDLNHIGIDYIWPTFNIADVGISIGFVALVLTSFKPKPKPEQAGSPPGSEASQPD